MAITRWDINQADFECVVVLQRSYLTTNQLIFLNGKVVFNHTTFDNMEHKFAFTVNSKRFVLTCGRTFLVSTVANTLVIDGQTIEPSPDKSPYDPDEDRAQGMKELMVTDKEPKTDSSELFKEPAIHMVFGLVLGIVAIAKWLFLTNFQVTHPNVELLFSRFPAYYICLWSPIEIALVGIVFVKIKNRNRT